MQYPEKLLHGVDYYPDQWIGHPEVLAEDLRLMKEAKISAVTLGVFAWSSLEPRDGVYLLYGDRENTCNSSCYY